MKDAPTGVRGRNSDNTLLRREIGWEPQTPLDVGMAATFEWILAEHRRLAAGAAG